MGTKLIISAQGFYEIMVLPAFQDIIPTDFAYKGTLNEFTLMPDVSSQRVIIDIRRHQNIMQRRDASCDINYKKLFGTTVRKVSVDEIYSAVMNSTKGVYATGAKTNWHLKKRYSPSSRLLL
jgi:hypothetical protein